LGGQPSTYLGSVSYAPHGGAWLMQYGNNVWHEVNYNSRLQPYQALDVINNDAANCFAPNVCIGAGPTI
jgi:hypothetical protein